MTSLKCFLSYVGMDNQIQRNKCNYHAYNKVGNYTFLSENDHGESVNSVLNI